MARARGLQLALGALVLLFSLVLLINLSATQVEAAPQPGEIFIDGNGDRTWDGGVVDSGLFATIQDAINATLPGNVVVVGPGTYPVALTIPTSIWLVGANENVDPNTGVRGPESYLIPRSGIDPLVILDSNAVKIDGFCFNGTNPALQSLGMINGVDVMTPYGLVNYIGENNLTFTNNIMANLDTAIALAGVSRNNVIGNNLFDNIGPVFGVGHAVELVSDYYANVENNVFTRTQTAVYASGFEASGASAVIGNTITGSNEGIVIERLRGSTGVWSVANNVIGHSLEGEAGIAVRGVEGTSASVILYANSINRMHYGIILTDNPKLGVSLIDGMITNCTFGIYAEEGSIAFVSGDSDYSLVGVNIVNPSSYGIFVDDTNSMGDGATRLSFYDGNVVQAGMNGLGVMGDGAIVEFNGPAPMNFNGTLDQHIRLINSSRDISAIQVMFFGLRAAEMTPTQYAALEAKLWHEPDNSELGFITVFVNVEITVTVLNDLTGNGQTGDDTPLQDWTVYLWIEGVIGEAMQTNSDGQFTWSNLGPANYSVSELLPSGWTATSATPQELGHLASGSTIDLVFTNFENVDITVMKMEDMKGDGITDDDIPLQDWTVYLWKDGVVGAAMQTDADGVFTWSDLGPGSYNVSEGIPAGWMATSASDHDFGQVEGGGSYNYTFTNFQRVSITATKLKDLTNDGQTPDDTPVQGWTVYLWTNGVMGPAQQTGADGTFTWAGLGPGSYNVSEGSSTGWNATEATYHDFGSATSGGVYNCTFTNFQTPSDAGLGDMTLILVAVGVISIVAVLAAVLLMRRRS